MLAPEDESRALNALRYSLASDIVELVVLTSDEAFLRTLREAMGESRRLWHIPTADKVSDLLLAGGVGILILDTQAVLDLPSVFVAQIKRQFPDLVVLVAGPRETEAELARLVTDGTVHRFIHKPMSPGRARLFADAAVKRYEEARRRGAAVVTPSLPRRESSRSGLLLGMGLVAVVAAAAAGWAWLQSSPPFTPPAAAPQIRTVAPPVDARTQRAEASADAQARAEGALAQQLSRALEPPAPAPAARPAAGASAQVEAAPRAADLAAQALARASEGRLIDPPEENARDLLLAALKADPRDATSLDAQETIALKLLAAIRAALDRSDLGEAARLLDAADGIASSSNLTPLRERLASAARAAAANPTPPVRAPAVAEPAIGAASAPIATRAAAPSAPSVPNAANTASAERAASSTAAMATAAMTPTPALATVAATNPATTAPTPSVPSDAVLPATQLTLLKSVQPIYPRRAEEQATEGWVEFEFTVDDRGAVRDIALLKSQPVGVFERAARDALAQWRYQPVLRDGTAVTQRARVRIRFTLNR